MEDHTEMNFMQKQNILSRPIWVSKTVHSWNIKSAINAQIRSDIKALTSNLDVSVEGPMSLEDESVLMLISSPRASFEGCNTILLPAK